MIYEEILLYNYKEFAKEYEDKKKQGRSLYKDILNSSNSKVVDGEEELYP